MGTIKRTTRRVAGKTKEVIAEVVGDGKLQEEAKAEQRKSEDEDKEPSDLNPLGNLHRLT
ncbi:CsbD family protein [Bradyrhizobium australiense]|uniref:CsbD family protein n=1 Tax=Bradyrhizobium australiense TaxID=2721161 RepID=UPI001AEEEC7E|nr:CsbD family protein [Bradyrhizobium australiense]